MAQQRQRKKTSEPGLPPIEQAIVRFKSLLPEIEFALLLKELENPLFPAIRTNMLKIAPQEAIKRWEDLYGWQVKPVPFCSTGWWVTHSEQSISQPIEHRLGYYYIQDAASMLPVSLFEINPGERPLILDMAASPGGKTTHLIDRSADLGLVVANDSSRDRITMLRLVLQNWGALNVGVTRFPGEKYGVWFPNTFDLVLLDAPCSMQNLRSTEARPMQTISAKERSTLAARQERLLISALQAVRVGGQVVYATCTLNPEEDEAVLDAILKLFPGLVEIKELSASLTAPAPGLGNITLDGQVRTFSPQVKNAVRMWPHIFGTSGFFAALIKKVKPIPTKSHPPPSLSLDRSALIPFASAETREFIDKLHQAFGFDFEPVLEAQQVSLWRRKEVIYAIPERWWENFSGFPFQAVGMRIAEESTLLIPSHEWVARFGEHFQKGVYLIPVDQIEAWLRGEDLPLVQDTRFDKGSIVAVKDDQGRLYGRGKVLTNRVRNLLPSRLVNFG